MKMLKKILLWIILFSSFSCFAVESINSVLAVKKSDDVDLFFKLRISHVHYVIDGIQVKEKKKNRIQNCDVQGIAFVDSLGNMFGCKNGDWIFLSRNVSVPENENGRLDFYWHTKNSFQSEIFKNIWICSQEIESSPTSSFRIPSLSDGISNGNGGILLVRFSMENETFTIALKIESSYFKYEKQWLDSLGCTIQNPVFNGDYLEKFRSLNSKGAEEFSFLLSQSLREFVCTVTSEKDSAEFYYPNCPYSHIGGYERAYLKLLFDSGMTVGGFKNSFDNHNLMQRRCANELERNSIVLKALEYIDCNVAYSMNQNGSEGAVAFESGVKIPMPYCADGIDTPEIFKCKMNFSPSEVFKAGSGKRGFLKYAGTDADGFVTGVLTADEVCGKVFGVRETDYKALRLRGFSDGAEEKFMNRDFSGNEMNEDFFPDATFTLCDVASFFAFIPYGNMVEKGDFLFSYDEKNRPEIAVVTYVPDDKNWNSIKVVALARKDNGTFFETTWSSLEENGMFYMPYRLLVKSENAIESSGNTGWNCLTGAGVEGKIEFKCIYEETGKTRNSGNWLYIPNTGEYLVCEGLKVKLMTTDKVPVECGGKKYRAKINLWDRNYQVAFDVEKLNITRNSLGSAFFVVLKTDQGKDVDYGIFRNVGKETYLLDEHFKEELFLMEDCTISYYSGGRPVKINSICIRPESPESFFPGDDIYISVNLAGNGISVDAMIDENLWLATYDKKALWRANLYMRERKSDWNEIHPWNAPPHYLAIESPWGCNEWNISCNPHTDYMNFSFDRRGNGKQVIEFSGYSSFRGQNCGIIYDTISYDYNFDANSNAWDSPFDFEYKLSMQKAALKNHFTGVCKDIYPEYNSERNYFDDGSYMSILTEQKKELFFPGVFPKNAFEEINGNKEMNFNLSRWYGTAAPNNRWKFYWKSMDESFLVPYVPGAGCFLYFKEKKRASLTSATGESEDLLSNLDLFSSKSCGTDCIGFVQRAMSYEGNRYAWTKSFPILGDILSGGTEVHDICREKNPLAYPAYNGGTKNCSEIISWVDACNKSHETSEYYYNVMSQNVNFENIKCKFLNVVPGDVITYGNAASSMNMDLNRSGAHIGLISDIDRKRILEANSLYELFCGIQVIESVYSGNVFNVVKRSCSGGDSVSHMEMLDSRNSSNWYADMEGNIRTWSIQRLEVIK